MWMGGGGRGLKRVGGGWRGGRGGWGGRVETGLGSINYSPRQ